MPRHRIRAHYEQLSEFERGRIIVLKEAGWMRSLEDADKNGADKVRFQRHDGSGQPRATTDREGRLIVRSAISTPDSLLSTIKLATHTRVSTMTIHRRQIERNLPSYRPLRHLPLTPAHCQARLLWCLVRLGWNHADWGHIVFSDESRFQMCPDNHRRRVWRRPGQREDPAFTLARPTGPQPGVTVWGAISFDSRTPLVVIRDTLTQDNARPHTAHVAMNCHTAYQILPWPARLPDLSPIEHVWNMMGRRLYLPGQVDDLVRQLEQIWKEMQQETIRVFYHSMSRRVAACIRYRGGSLSSLLCNYVALK
ncbi:transposable element Tcb2 transposase [Trichonephila clavipes]|uniref:Transposable element Tcb2 transposase n=1 Tax=Trichonephila clavipes TaxID=2585209 RepID=A0A8X6RUZ4_TRICX|nr:transposable element Tcb2 transposase [Trichonephila clavipes]